MVFEISSKKSNKVYVKVFIDKDEAYAWVQNHLDLSLEWSIKQRGKDGK